MGLATATPFIDVYHPKTDTKRMVSIRVTFDRKRKYYATNIQLKPSEFQKIMTAKRRSESENKIFNELLGIQSKALNIIQSLSIFSFGKFEELFLESREATNLVTAAFDVYIKELRDQQRIGTAVSYECARNSLAAFAKQLTFTDITPSFLKRYESWMLADNKSLTTVGIYLRSLRTIFNRAEIDKSLYPFGEGSKKYAIPTGRNIKKALTLQEISSIFNYPAPDGTTIAMARDYWIFIYLCNGLNVKDLCLLKYKNILGDIIVYERAKTKRTRNNGEKIRVALKPQTKVIIERWGQMKLNEDTYLFPHLQPGMLPAQQRAVIQQLTKTINKYMKRIAQELGLSKPVTSYYARHSFATVLRNAGATTEFISEALGHSNIKTTQSYLAGFDERSIHQATDALIAFEQPS